MKKIWIIILIIISFVLGVFVSKVYFKENIKSSISTEQNNKPTEVKQSGVYKDLYFQNLRKDGDIYYIKFSKQKEGLPLPEKCHSENLSEEEDLNCIMIGKSTQVKTLADIDLSKEYKFSNNGLVELITYDSKYLTFVDLGVGTFYKYLNNLEKPWSNFYSFSSNNLEYLSFDVTMIDGEIANLKEVYKE